MKSFITIALTLMLTTAAFGALRNAPFPPEIDKRFSDLENVTPIASGDVTVSSGVSSIGAGKVLESMLQQMGATQALYAMRVAHAVWDTTVSSGGAVGAHTLGVALPAKALITQVYDFSLVQPTTAAAGTVALSCGSATLLTAVDVTGYTVGSIHSGNQTGTAANMTDAVTACTVTATVATGTMTAGKLDIYVQYVVHQ